MTEIRTRGVTDFAALGARWRDLETRANPSFFQSWTWTGCLVEERFPDPVLVEATEGSQTVALGLFNRIRTRFGSRLCLGETGEAERDSPYIEHNGILAEAGRETALTILCLRAAARSHDVVLSGIGDVQLDAARQAAGRVCITKRNESPFADLAATRRAGADYLAGRSANTRQQIRRSDRSYEALGPLTLRRAQTVTEAQVMLNQMAALHQASWTARGQPGSFARPFFGRFHHALLERGFARGELSLQTTAAGKTLIGILYNFSYRGCVLAYQSGFDYTAATAQQKPGLTCHHMAIRQALADGTEIYDFLAGDDRYKRSLADGSKPQYWIEAGPAWSPRLLARRLRGALRSSRRIR